jgi:hypothetical protein
MTPIRPAVLVAVLITACQPAGQIDEGFEVSHDPAPGGMTTGTVVRVNDGDSVVVETGSGVVEVRLMGINTPERDEFSSDEQVDVGGWVIRDESSQHRCHLSSGAFIDQGEGLVVSSVDPCWDPGDSSVWNNGGDMALLLDPSGRVVARYRYLG